MSIKLFSPSPLFGGDLSLLRVIVGLLMIYHGWEVFDANKIKEYATWNTFRETQSPLLMVYIGKTSELVGGLLLALGLFTRIGSLLIAFTLAYICFFVGNGKFWYEDQHPFLFVLLALVFFITGPGKWSIDFFLSNKKNTER